MSKYRCGLHGPYTPDFERVIDDHACPRVLCEECERASCDMNMKNRPKNVPYFYEDVAKVVLQEAHLGSAIWRFDPPVIHPEWYFAEDLTPIVPEGALTSDEIMAKMETLLPEIERIARESGVNLPDPRDLLIMPGRNMRVQEDPEGV